ncbi:hypothetical protein Droror1_Dr00020321 [Drosera rotundifolia]
MDKSINLRNFLITSYGVCLHFVGCMIRHQSHCYFAPQMTTLSAFMTCLLSMAGSSALFPDFSRSNASEGMLGIGSRGLNKQDMVSAGFADERSHTSDGSESLYLKSPDNGK